MPTVGKINTQRKEEAEQAGTGEGEEEKGGRHRTERGRKGGTRERDREEADGPTSVHTNSILVHIMFCFVLFCFV